MISQEDIDRLKSSVSIEKTLAALGCAIRPIEVTCTTLHSGTSLLHL